MWLSSKDFSFLWIQSTRLVLCDDTSTCIYWFYFTQSLSLKQGFSDWTFPVCLLRASFWSRCLCQSAVKNLAGRFGLTIVADGHLFGFSAKVLSMSRHKDGVHFEPDRHIVQGIQQNWLLMKVLCVFVCVCIYIKCKCCYQKPSPLLLWTTAMLPDFYFYYFSKSADFHHHTHSCTHVSFNDWFICQL